MMPRTPWQRRELEQREQAIEVLLNQEALARVTLHRPERKTNRSAVAWLRSQLARVREDLGHVA